MAGALSTISVADAGDAGTLVEAVAAVDEDETEAADAVAATAALTADAHVADAEDGAETGLNLWAVGGVVVGAAGLIAILAYLGAVRRREGECG